MINLREFVKDYICESILDDIDDQLEAGDKYIDKVRAEKWAEKFKKKPYITIQKKGYVLVGDFIIDDINEKEYTGTPIKKVTGNISIVGCEIESLKGLFLPDCVVTGTLTIEGCPNFISLEGAPKEVGSLVINENKNFKSLDYCPKTIVNNLYLYKNGKRFDREKIINHPHIFIGKRIFCSAFNEQNTINEEHINEAFKAPQLMILADAIKKVSNKTMAPDISDLLGGIQLDKISASAVHEYDSKDPNVSKRIRAIMARKHNGFFFILNKDGEAVYLCNYRGYLSLLKRESYSYYDNTISKYSNMSSTQVSSLIKLAEAYDMVIFVDIEDEDKTYQIRRDRALNQEGAIAMQKGYERKGSAFGLDHITHEDVRYYQDIANANRYRYKEMLLKIKAERAANTNAFGKYKKEVDALFDRYTALVEKMLMNPKKYDRWREIDRLNEEFNSKSSYEPGLMYTFSEYFEALKDASSGYSYGRNTIDNQVQKFETNLTAAISRVNNKLTELERK